jgi:PDZ domain-containing protein
VRRRLSPGRLVVAGLILLAVVAGVLWLAPSSDYIFLPDPAHPVSPLVKVPHPKTDEDGGGIYFVDVIVQKATLLERLFPGLQKGSTLVPASSVNPPGTDDRQRRTVDLSEMARSQEIAAAVALKQLGYDIGANADGALVTDVVPKTPADGKLRPTDVIVAVGEKAVRTPNQLRALMSLHKPGDRVALTVRSSAGLRKETVGTIADRQDPKHALLGVIVQQAANIKLPFPVTIDAGSVGGPSAGLAFALEVMEKLGHDVDHGHKIAATGEIGLDGTVGPIGGVKQKTIGARNAHVDAFLVPAGENAAEARRYADGLKIIPVQNFRQALHALATLPPAS